MTILPGLPGGPPYVLATVQITRGLDAIRAITPAMVALQDAHIRWFMVTADQARDARQKRTGVL